MIMKLYQSHNKTLTGTEAIKGAIFSNSSEALKVGDTYKEVLVFENAKDYEDYIFRQKVYAARHVLVKSGYTDEDAQKLIPTAQTSTPTESPNPS